MITDPDVIIEKIALTDANINPCRGCNACEKLNACGQAMAWTSTMTRSSPLTFPALLTYLCMGIASQPKALIDRAQVFRSRKYVLKTAHCSPGAEGKTLGIFLASAGQNWDYVFDAAIPSVKCFYHVIDIKDNDISYLRFTGWMKKGRSYAPPLGPTPRNSVKPCLLRSKSGLMGDFI